MHVRRFGPRETRNRSADPQNAGQGQPAEGVGGCS